MKFFIIFCLLAIMLVRKSISSAENNCIKSNTVVNGSPVECSDQLLFSKNFHGNQLSRITTIDFRLLNGRIELKAALNLDRFRKRYKGFSGLRFEFTENKTIDLHLSSLKYRTIQYQIHSIVWNDNSIEYLVDGNLLHTTHFKVDNQERNISLVNNKDVFSYLWLMNMQVYSTPARYKTSPCDEATVTEILPLPMNAFCKGNIIFEDSFNKNFDESKWMHEIQGPRRYQDEEFSLSDGRVTIKDGSVHIKPKLWRQYRPDLNIFHSSLNLNERCTSLYDFNSECVMQSYGIGPLIMPPIVAPRISTKTSFSFKYGKIEIRAKFPKGDWIVPLLILEPLIGNYGRSGYDSGQIRVAMARGNEDLNTADGQNISGQTLFGGPVLSTDAQWRNRFMVNRTQSQHFGDEFHVYGMEWLPNGMKFFVDGECYGVIYRNDFQTEPFLNKRWKRNDGSMAPFDTFFYITLGISVGGFGDFPDGVKSKYNEDKPWNNLDPMARFHFWQQNYKWYSTWTQPQSDLVIDYVRVTAV